MTRDLEYSELLTRRTPASAYSTTVYENTQLGVCPWRSASAQGLAPVMLIAWESLNCLGVVGMWMNAAILQWVLFSLLIMVVSQGIKWLGGTQCVCGMHAPDGHTHTSGLICSQSRILSIS